MSDPMRLSKRLIQITGCTRREAELYIEGGWVTVDGIVVEHPQHQVTEELVVLNPDADVTSAGPATLLINCPSDMPLEKLLPTLEQANRWEEDTSALPTLKKHFLHLTESFPLEQGASGLCILTQNRYLIPKWKDQQTTLEQEYVVDFKGEITETVLKQLNGGMSGAGKRLPIAKVSRQAETRLRFAIKNPQPGQINLMCESVGLTVEAIRRLRIGAIALRKMPLGQWRYLPEGERF